VFPISGLVAAKALLKDHKLEPSRLNGGCVTYATASGRSKFDPDIIAPIPAPIVLTPPVFGIFVLFPLPIIGIDIKPEFRTIFISLLGVPTIALFVTNDLG
jgi:hypothetical protein